MCILYLVFVFMLTIMKPNFGDTNRLSLINYIMFFVLSIITLRRKSQVVPMHPNILSQYGYRHIKMVYIFKIYRNASL